MADEAESETRLSRGEIATYLGQLSAAFDASGEVRLTVGDDVVAVSPPDECAFEVEYEREGDEAELEIEIGWSDDGSESAAVEASGAAEDSTEDERSTMGAEGPTSDAADELADASESDDGTEPPPDETEPEPNDETVAGGVPVSAESQARFELFEDEAGEWRWRLVHRNGNIIATSGEGYTRKAKAEKGMRSVKRNAQGAPARLTD